MNKKIEKTQKRPKLDINEFAFSIVMRATGEDTPKDPPTEKATTEASQPQLTPSEPTFHKQ